MNRLKFSGGQFGLFYDACGVLSFATTKRKYQRKLTAARNLLKIIVAR
jgi:hypothetical protein